MHINMDSQVELVKALVEVEGAEQAEEVTVLQTAVVARVEVDIVLDSRDLEQIPQGKV
jgi:hypothetical protein